MMVDTSKLPISGGLILACVIYAGASLYAGQIVGTRSIERSGWTESCNADLTAALAANRRPERILPETDCQSTIGWVLPEVGQLCRQFGNPDLGGPIAAAEREAERRAQVLADRALARAAANTSSRCACAAAVYSQEQMIPLAVYAGTARTISLPSIRTMQDGLMQSLGNPQCAEAGESGP